jgi:hypothetical protein
MSTRTLEDFQADNVIDLRDIIERWEELKEELQERHEAGQFMSDFDDWIANSRDHSEPIYAAFGDAGSEVQSNIEEFYKLNELLDELRGNGGDARDSEGNWYPLSMIRDDYFVSYAQELAEDIGAIDVNASWPARCIDWDQAARELQMDYSTVEFDGVTYWYR